MAERPLAPALGIDDVERLGVWQPTARERLQRWALVFGTFALYLVGAGSFGLWDPWETHYGEVTRGMIESYDWVNPWWGYKTKIGSEPVAGKWFYSKPIFIFWAEAAFVRLIGLSDWALRLPIALIGATMVAMVQLTIERIVSARAGLLAALAVGLSPFIYMVSRQAQTDMPFVGLMTIGMCFILMALFARRVAMTDRAFMLRTLQFVALWALNLVPQWSIIATDLIDPNAGSGVGGVQGWLLQVQQNGVWHLLVWVPVGLGVLLSALWPVWRRRGDWDDAFKDRMLRRYWLLAFYLLVAQASYAKGLLGFMLPGAILFVFFLLSWRWRLLARVELLRGIPLFLVAGLPWYVAMFCRHGWAYYNRFFVHDHFNRVGAGVHQIDSGTFEHFIKWLGYGLFPWTAFVPLALVGYATFRLREPASGWASAAGQRVALRLMLFSWFFVAFALFTISSTKFHHYILPAAPALGMIVALYLDDLLEAADEQRARLHVLLAGGFAAAVLTNLLGNFQNLRNLFTYKYDRPLPENLEIDWPTRMVWKTDPHPMLRWDETSFVEHLGGLPASLVDLPWLRFDVFLPAVGALVGLGLAFMLVRRLRAGGIATVAAGAALLAFWALNVYMPTLTPHWSQRYLFETYYSDCELMEQPDGIVEAYTPMLSRIGLASIPAFFDARPKRVCREDIISWLITWRGETYYSNNEIRPINKEATQFEPYLEEFNKGKTFYILMERGRAKGVKGKLDRLTRTLRGKDAEGWADIERWEIELVSNESQYFVLGKATPITSDEAAKARQRGSATPAKKATRPATKPAPPTTKPAVDKARRVRRGLLPTMPTLSTKRPSAPPTQPTAQPAASKPQPGVRP